MSFCLSVSLSVYLHAENEAILRDFLNFWTWKYQKHSNSARLPQCLNLTTSKTKQFCETSSCFKVDNIKNEAILRHLKLSAELTASCQCVLRFFQSTCLKCCACHEKVMAGHTKCCACHAKSSQQSWRSDAPKRLPSFLEMLQNPEVLLTFDKVHNPLRLPRETTS